MRLWWLSRSGWLVLAVTAGTSVLAFVVRDVDYYFPNFLTGAVSKYPLGCVLALLPGLAWIISVLRAEWELEEVAVRKRLVARADWLIGVVPPAIAAGLLAFGGHERDWLVARDLIFFSSLSVLSLAVLWRYYAFLVPVGYLLVASAFGFSLGAEQADGWAFVLTRWEPGRDSWILALCAIASVVVMEARRARR